MVKAMVGGCCVCSDERGWDENPLVYCDGHGCNVAVHQACYGIVQVPKGPWFCRKCESQERIARVKCELCPSKSGALKRTDSGGWAHVVCALYIPEVRFGNVTTMEPIILASVPHERYIKMCYICEERGKESKTAHGCCMNCNKQGCRQTFHVTCAQSCGLLCEENDGQSGPTVKYVGYCQFHWNKRSKGLLDLTKTNDKDRMRLKLDKDKEKKPKPRTSSESASTSILPPKPDITCRNSSPVTDSPSQSLTSSPSNSIPGMPKPRGRKPSTVVKSLPTNSTASNDSSNTQSTNQVKESPLNSPLPQSGPMLMEVETTVSITKPLNITTVTTTSVVSPAQSFKNVLSSSQSVGQPTPTPPPVSVSTPPAKPAGKPSASAEKLSAGKPASVSVKASSGEVKQPPKKRPSSKSIEEPKRKVGRPLKHAKPKPRPSGSKPSKPRSQNRSKDTSNSLHSTESYRYSGFNSMSTSGPVSIHNHVPSTHGTYVIPQPRRVGQLENGHRVTDSKQTNGPLQLPNTLEQLLEYQWEQGAQYVMQQASQFDVASLMSSLHQLKADNSRLENRLESLLARRSQLIHVNTRLSAPMSCTPTSTSTITTDTTNKQPNKVTTSCTTSTLTTETNKTESITKTTTSVTNVQTVESPNQAPRVSATLSYSPSTMLFDNMNTNVKGKADVPKSSAAKVTIPVSVATGTVAMTNSETSSVPKMTTPNTVGMQPSQIKITMVQPHSLEKDKQKIAILPTAVTLQSTIPSQFLTGQQLQVLQSKTSQSNHGKGTKQPVILPHQPPTSQAFTTQHIPQHQLLLLMQQQQRQHHLNDQRLITNQSQLSSMQIKSGSSGGHSQNFVPSAMQLGFPSNFLTLSDGHIDVSKGAAFTTLPTLVQLDKPKGLDMDKNGTALPGEKNIRKS